MPLLILLLFGAATAYLASRKNRNPIIWGVLGFIFNIVALGIILCLRPGNCAETAKIEKKTIATRPEYDPSLLDKYNITDFVKNNSIVDVVGVFAATAIAIGVIVTYLSMGGVPGILLCLIMWWKFSTIWKHFNTPGFGKGVLIYVAYITIAVSLAFMTIIDSLSMLGRDWLNIVYAIGMVILGLAALPKISNHAKEATPFMAFLFSAGLAFILLQIKNNSDSLAVDDSVAVDHDNTILADTEIASTISYDMSNYVDANIAPLPMPADANSALAAIGVADSPMPMNIDSSLTSIDFATPSNLAPELMPVDNTIAFDNGINADYPIGSATHAEYQISDSSGMIQGHIISDGETAKIYDNENVIAGTISQDGGAFALKDTQQNTMLIRDSSGFISTPEGMPIAHVEHSGLVDTIRDTETNKIIIRDEISGIIRDSDGNVLGRINKK